MTISARCLIEISEIISLTTQNLQCNQIPYKGWDLFLLNQVESSLASKQSCGHCPWQNLEVTGVILEEGPEKLLSCPRDYQHRRAQEIHVAKITIFTLTLRLHHQQLPLEERMGQALFNT